MWGVAVEDDSDQQQSSSARRGGAVIMAAQQQSSSLSSTSLFVVVVRPTFLCSKDASLICLLVVASDLSKTTFAKCAKVASIVILVAKLVTLSKN